MLADNESEFLEESDLFRRIPPEQIIFDHNINEYRPTSQNFDDEKMSVDIEAVLVEKNLDWHFTLKGHEKFSLVRFPARFTRDLGQKMIFCPTPEDPAHGKVLGRKTRSIRNNFVRQSKWVHLNSPEANPE